MGVKDDDEEKVESTPLISSSSHDENTTRIDETVTSGTSAATIWQDIVDTIRLGGPIFITFSSFVLMKTTDSALLGRVGADALSAAALSDLWTMCTMALLMGRVLGILVGGAIGAGNPKLAGLYLQTSLFVLAVLAIPVVLAWNLTEQFWVAFGSDLIVSANAGLYARILSLSIPGQLIITQLDQFFSAQRIMHPGVTASLVALVCNLVLGMIFVLGYPFPNFDGYGFIACPIVTMLVVYVQLCIICGYYVQFKRLHETCWDGWCLREALSFDRLRTFSGLYFPTALSGASDYWRVAAVGAVAAKLGEAEVAVFNTSYRIMWIALILVQALMGASVIKLTIRLGQMDPQGARQSAYVGLGLATVIMVLLFMAVVSQIRFFGSIFTNDEDFLVLFEGCKWPFASTLLLMNLSTALERIPLGMGRTSEVFWLGFISSWGFQVPGVLLVTHYWRNDLVGLYTGMTIGYFALSFLYGILAFTSDWEKYAMITRDRSEHDHLEHDKHLKH